MQIKPLFDRVLIKKPEEGQKTASGLIIMSPTEAPCAGIVVATGDGIKTDKDTTPMQVKTGDKVFYNKYAGTEMNFGTEKYIIIKQTDILAIIEE